MYRMEVVDCADSPTLIQPEELTDAMFSQRREFLRVFRHLYPPPGYSVSFMHARADVRVRAKIILAALRVLSTMARIQSGTVARILSRFRKPRLELQTYFDVPESLWRRMQAYAKARAVEAPEQPLNPSPVQHHEAPRLLHDLFQLSNGANQKALVGSLLLEHAVGLPVSLDKQYLRSLVEIGLAPAALRLWKQRAITSKEERSQWNVFGIELYCRAFRPNQAEALVSKIVLTIPICLEFITVYSQLKQDQNTHKWCSKLTALNPHKSHTNAALRMLIEAKLWPQVQALLADMNRLGHSVDPKLTVSCFDAAAALPLDVTAFPGLAALLESDGGLLNVPKFRRALGVANDPKIHLRSLLNDNKTDDALRFLADYRGPHLIGLAYEMLQYAINLPSDSQIRQRILNDILPRVQDNSACQNNSVFIQFMLVYLQHAATFEDVWRFMNRHHLLSSAPPASLPKGTNLHSHLSYDNYYKIWQILHRYLRDRDGSAPLVQLDLRQFVLATVSRVALQPTLLRLMVLSLNTLPDLPALASLLMFAQESSNVCLDPSKLFPNERLSIRLDSHWRDIAQVFADKHHADLDSVIAAGADWRKTLQL